jgi:hypothetical protein
MNWLYNKEIKGHLRVPGLMQPFPHVKVILQHELMSR